MLRRVKRYEKIFFQAEAETEAEFTPRERRVLLQKMFMQVGRTLLRMLAILAVLILTMIPWTMQVLLRLCAHIAAVEELARKDDLTLLFSAIRWSISALYVLYGTL